MYSLLNAIAHSFDVVTATNMVSGWGLGLFSKLVQAGSLTFLSIIIGVICCMCHVSSRIVVDISESSLLCSQCFFRPHWNKDNMLSENYHYLYTCFSKLCSSDCFSFILSFPIISPYFRFIIKHKNYYGVICCMLSTCHVSSRIVADISESSLLFSQCFFRPYWNEDEMLSENYPYF